MPQSTQERLDAYLAAEAAILARGQAVQLSERRLQQAELETIRRAISQLQQQLAREQSTSPGRGSLRYKTAVFDR